MPPSGLKLLILQARMNSTRLPGKVLKPILGRPMLAYQWERLQRCTEVDQWLIATTERPEDDALAGFSENVGASCFRGAESDVLARFYHAAEQAQAQTVIRVTGDCPLLDPHTVDAIIQAYQSASPAVDYASNTLSRTFPRGQDVEIFSFSALETAFQQALTPEEREHVTPYLYRHPGRFRLLKVAQADHQAHHRWTVDTPEDFELITRILTALYPTQPHFTQADVLALLSRHPEWMTLNAHVPQVRV